MQVGVCSGSSRYFTKIADIILSYSVLRILYETCTCTEYIIDHRSVHPLLLSQQVHHYLGCTVSKCHTCACKVFVLLGVQCTGTESVGVSIARLSKDKFRAIIHTLLRGGKSKLVHSSSTAGRGRLDLTVRGEIRRTACSR